MVAEQQVPGLRPADAEELEAKGLPDGCVFTDDGWAALFECKVQAHVNLAQLERHLNTAIARGFESPRIIVISVDEETGAFPDGTTTTTWKQVYAWFSRRAHESLWASELVQYMETFERKMLATHYDIRGTITMFDGLRFDRHNPYTDREGKRLIRLLGDELQTRKDLHEIGVDPDGERRPAITGSGTDSVWDFVPLRVARGAQQFTHYPHLTMALDQSRAVAAVTIPNGVKGGFRTKLASLGAEGLVGLVTKLEKNLRPITRRSRSAKPIIYVSQRHYKTQRSRPDVDAHIETDLRTILFGGRSGVRYQPEWVEAIFEVLTNKRSNLQLGVEVRLSYDCPVVRTAEAVDLFADSWKALSPLVLFVLEDMHH